MTGILIAMKEEIAKLISLLKEKETIEYKGKTFFKGKLENKEVVLALAGIGKVNASYTVTLLIEHFGCDYIINTGIAGGLGKLKTLEVMFADKVCQHDMDTSPIGDPKGWVSGVNKIYFDCSLEILEKIKTVMEKINVGVVASGDQFVASKERANFISQEFNAIACDMECGAIGQICYMNGVKFNVIKTISDDAVDGSGITFLELCERACEINANAILTILKAI